MASSIRPLHFVASCNVMLTYLGRYKMVDILQTTLSYVFLNKDYCVLVGISRLNSIPKDLINNKQAWVHMMAWGWSRDIIWTNDGLARPWWVKKSYIGTENPLTLQRDFLAETTIPFSQINLIRYNFMLIIIIIHATDHLLALVNGGDSASIIYMPLQVNDFTSTMTGYFSSITHKAKVLLS